ncbi:VOC family protein [Rhodococcus opacus]|uniref:VOC family protein n=1 Tax=Rhodococcus opacus TaxID=37919 RepID=UPI00295471C7|nr:VOC family protein [Rhodococcus opacus]MDV7090430.1 VOC family protein [Rhodococcus opacus]
MKLRLHHVNVVSDDMGELHEFYSKALGLTMAPLPPMIEHLGHQNERTEAEDDDKWRQNVAFFDASGDSDGDQQIHAGRRQAYLGARMGHAVNPLATGHFAFRTDDLDEVRKHLTDAGIPFSDYGEWAVKNWDQIFLTDPAGNVIEIHQILDSSND